MATEMLDELVAKASKLPADKLRQVVTLVDELAADAPPATPPAQHPLFGCLSHLGPAPTLEEFQELRREMWANFPRPFPPEAGGE